ncbi:MAG: hypothetical protein IPG84_02575 [Betaproteobacteria bacterium]|nr:hypothetical protein [Betaproteobacteria bacterium]
MQHVRPVQTRTAFVGAVFFLSGAAALVYQSSPFCAPSPSCLPRLPPPPRRGPPLP